MSQFRRAITHGGHPAPQHRALYSVISYPDDNAPVAMTGACFCDLQLLSGVKAF